MRKWLLDARTKAGLSQQETASKLNLTRQYYTMIENGQRQKSLDIQLAQKISKLFGMSLEQIAQDDKIIQ